jgi:UDP-N-acetylbacillosamine N-acetyltransferase
MKSLLIIGAGGHGQVVAETAAACGYEKMVFLDDSSPDAVGKTDELEELAKCYDGVIVSIGNGVIRRELIRRIQHIGAPLVSLIHPRAYIAPSATVGAGSIVLPGAVVHSNAVIGISCIISIGALIDHDVVVDDFSHINTGAIVGSGKKVGGKVDAGGII